MWVSTLLFVILSIAIAGMFTGAMWPVRAGFCALVVSPILWWVLVAKPSRAGIVRGAIAGALTAATAHLVPLMLAILWFDVTHPSRYHDGMGEAVENISRLFAIGNALRAAIFGAVLGAILIPLTRMPAARNEVGIGSPRS